MNLCPICFTSLKKVEEEDCCLNESLHQKIHDIMIIYDAELTVEARGKVFHELKTSFNGVLSSNQCEFIAYLTQLEIYLNSGDYSGSKIINFFNIDLELFNAIEYEIEMISHVICWFDIINMLATEKFLTKLFMDYYSEDIGTQGWNRITLYFSVEDKITFDFIDQYKDKLDWFIVSSHLHQKGLLSIKIINKYYKYIKHYLEKKRLLEMPLFVNDICV
jgi:hypothetical protein